MSLTDKWLQLLHSFLGHGETPFHHAPCLWMKPPESSPVLLSLCANFVSRSGVTEFWVGRNPVVKGNWRRGTHGNRDRYHPGVEAAVPVVLVGSLMKIGF